MLCDGVFGDGVICDVVDFNSVICDGIHTYVRSCVMVWSVTLSFVCYVCLEMWSDSKAVVQYTEDTLFSYSFYCNYYTRM